MSIVQPPVSDVLDAMQRDGLRRVAEEESG